MSYAGRAWHVPSFGLEKLALVDTQEPAPGPGQITIAVRAASLNYRDLLMVKGRYDPRMKLPLVPLSDGVGEVVALGEGVTRVKVGDRVAATFAPRWIAGAPSRDNARHTRGGPLPGMLTTHRTLNAEGVVHLPEGLSWEAAATLPCAALTAWSALRIEGSVGPGDTILVQGTGGVSLFALQFAGLLGARAIVTSSSDEKLERAKTLGAWQTINYRQDEDWGKTAATLCPGGVDHVVEVGGAATLEQSLRSVRIGGTISLIGILSGASAPVPLTRVLMNQIRVQGILVGHRAGFEDMNRAIAAHGLAPVVDRVFPMDDAPAAFAHLASGKHFGKVVIRTSEG